jgi:hypothetical protein
LCFAVLCAAALPALATGAQGYALTLTPVLHHGTQWLIASADERSDPNMATQDRGVLPSRLRERHWWVLFDQAGQARCTLARRDGQGLAADALRAALQRGCRHAPAVLRRAAGWSTPAAPDAAGTALTWSPRQVCAAERCTAARSTQRTVFNRAPRAHAPMAALPATAHCVAAQWLVVRNMQAEDGSGRDEGTAFVGLPPPVPADIVGHEFVQVDGVAVRPAAWRCP